jgi:hypothetical protein|tara:strand:+ start:1357 stop:1536 length:180 start_codon:yes stop_codon:yes gene_type:complete
MLKYIVTYEDPERAPIECLTEKAAQFLMDCHRDIIASQAARPNAVKDRWGTVKMEVVNL